ncbi:ribosomal RNA-processing protein 8 [Diachasma alloeum]|uniref:ribosomal RNA-processing protein 8 n=1 Tax=Diachasma alloeum TaxID=454923 RepID=UPI0007383EE0|nr:ribosomal RNA-processing protein 8 [Diachasma alloeum]
MISLSNSDWEKSEVGDSLSKQLFTKTNSQKKRKNRDKKKLKNSKSPQQNTAPTDPAKDQILSLKKNLQVINQKTLNSKIDKNVHSTKKSTKKNPAESKKQATTNKQFFKSLKQKSLSSNPNERPKSKKPKFSPEKNSQSSQNPSKSPKKLKPKSKKNKRNADERNEQRSISKPNLSKKLKPENKQESKRKIVRLNLSGKTKINVTKLAHLLEVKNKGVVEKPQSLRERMVAQLRASRFRYLNEELYKNDSTVSKQMFKEDPEAFKAYHDGYQRQVNQWPVNPLDVIITAVKKMPKDWIIADFGCGEARLAASVSQKVHSIDLVALNDRVTACDMAHTPLLIGGVNVVVFCLSLMGTNLNDYLREANRVLKKEGILKIAEVESRFDNIEEFINLLASFGFKNTWKDLSHNLFYFMDFKKISEVTMKNQKLPQLTLKPCLYKKR